jgi:hypothetical protein
MTTSQFWKGLAMLLVSIVLSAFNQVPLDWALLFVAGVSSIFGYVGKNIIFLIDTTSAWAKIVSGLLVALGTGIFEAAGLIAIEGKILWIVFFKVVGGVLLTYIVATFLTVPSVQSRKMTKLALVKK